MSEDRSGLEGVGLGESWVLGCFSKGAVWVDDVRMKVWNRKWQRKKTESLGLESFLSMRPLTMRSLVAFSPCPHQAPVSGGHEGQRGALDWGSRISKVFLVPCSSILIASLALHRESGRFATSIALKGDEVMSEHPVLRYREAPAAYGGRKIYLKAQRSRPAHGYDKPLGLPVTGIEVKMHCKIAVGCTIRKQLPGTMHGICHREHVVDACSAPKQDPTLKQPHHVMGPCPSR